MAPDVMLEFDWELVGAIPITAVVGRRCESGDWETAAFVVGENAVVLSVNEDTDEILVSLTPSGAVTSWEPFTALSHLVGRTFGWCWCTTNYRGYHDGFIIAFGDVAPDALEPRVMFLGEASALSCLEVTPLNG